MYKLLKDQYINKDGEIKSKKKESYKKWWHRNIFRISNKYLRQFYYRGIARFIRKFPKRNRIFRNRGSYKRDKEITEALAVINAFKEFNIDPKVVFDLGSGVGFFTQINSVVYPNSFTYAVDNNNEMRVDQFAEIPNAQYHHMDIYSEGFDEWIKGTQNPVTLVGVHLCFDLSPRLIELFNKHPNVHNMVLLPCCHKGMNYQTWMATLYNLISEPNKTSYIDDRIISVRDGVIVAKRSIPSI